MSDNRTMSMLSPNDVRMMSPSAVSRRQRIARQRTVSPVFRVVRNDVRVLFRLLPV
jgi:hypothetical protein